MIDLDCLNKWQKENDEFQFGKVPIEKVLGLHTKVNLLLDTLREARERIKSAEATLKLYANAIIDEDLEDIGDLEDMGEIPSYPKERIIHRGKRAREYFARYPEDSER